MEYKPLASKKLSVSLFARMHNGHVHNREAWFYCFLRIVYSHLLNGARRSIIEKKYLPKSVAQQKYFIPIPA